MGAGPEGKLGRSPGALQVLLWGLEPSEALYLEALRPENDCHWAPSPVFRGPRTLEPGLFGPGALSPFGTLLIPVSTCKTL